MVGSTRRVGARSSRRGARSKRVHLRKILVGVAALATPMGLSIGSLATAAGGATRATGGSVLRVGYFASLAGGAAPALGTHFGWFRKAGLRVSFVPFTAAPAAAAALVGGSIDMYAGGMNGAINGLAGYARIVALDDYDNDAYLLSSPGSGITSIAGLRGKSVGYTEGTNSQIVLQLALDSAHMTLHDVNAINLEPTAIVSAFDSGKIDAASIYLPFEAAITSAIAGTHVLGRASRFLGQSAIPLVWVASDRAISSEKPEILKFLGVLAKARTYRASHLRQTAGIVDAFAKAPSIKPFLDQMTAEGWPTSRAVLSFYKDGGMQLAWQRIDKVLVQAGIAKSLLPASKVMDLSLDESVLGSFVSQ